MPLGLWVVSPQPYLTRVVHVGFWLIAVRASFVCSGSCESGILHVTAQFHLLSPDSMHVDLPLSLQSSVQLGLSLLVFGLTRLGLTLLSLDLASLGPGLFLQTLACLGLTPLVYGIT